ncbi:MAG: hypothetical protein K9K37_04695 [Desulfocapsa sp.]|nr:hypothetical protein [Desulfocapsa sp.]
MRKNTFLFFPIFFLLLSLGALQIPAAADTDTEHVPIQITLPDPLPAQLSADGKTLFNGLPLKAVIDDPTPQATLRRIPAPAGLTTDPEAATSTFSITYVPNGGTDPWTEACYTFPEEAKVAFNAAANIWANTLHSSVPIKIRACWGNLGSSLTLGYSGGGNLYRDFPGATRATTWYAVSLANALSGTDQDSPGEYNMHITYNSNFSWYYGTDGNPPVTQHDLMTVVLHEIAHGLNFSGSMNYAGGVGDWGYNYPPLYPNIYDVFVRDGSGKQLITYSNVSTALGSALVSNDLWFHGNQAMAANGSQRVKMYAPSSWSGGSSYSHLDYSTFNNTANQLMVYAVSKGESIHDPGVITRGLLSDLGWTASPYVVPPSSSSSPWVLFQAAINAASTSTPPPPSPPQWGAGSAVCCSTSSTLFSLTSSGITKRSYVANCSTTGTWEGWQVTTPGTKSFSYSLTSATCGNYGGSFSWPLVEGREYYFQIELEGSDLVVYVYEDSITSSTQTEAATSEIQSAAEIKASMNLVGTIPLDIPKGVFSASSCEVAE